MKRAVTWFFKNWANFSGRATRKEYWLYFFVMMGLSMVSSVTLKPYLLASQLSSLIYFFVFLIPGLAITIRRLHDIGKSGWNFLFGLIPFVGAIILLVFFCRKSQEGENRYGPSPVA